NRESAHDVYSKRMIVVVTELKIVEWRSYKHLDWITVRRDDDKLYKFKECDLKRLRLQDIEDMLLLLVQGKLSNLTVEECFAFNVSLRMFTRSIVIQRRVEDLQLGVKSYQKRLNLTKPDTYRSDLKRREADGTLNDVRTALDDRLKGIRVRLGGLREAWKGSLEEGCTKETSGCYKGPYELSYAAPILQEETLKRRWRYLIPANSQIHNHMLIPDYQDIIFQDFRYFEEFECYQVIKIGRITTTAKVPLRKPIPLESNPSKPVVTLVYLRKPKESRNNVPVSKSKINKSLSSEKKEPNKS
nr:hypothetical protein [Tanacetum cinerariifolium]